VFVVQIEHILMTVRKEGLVSDVTRKMLFVSRLLFCHHLHSPLSSAYIFLLFIQWHQIRCHQLSTKSLYLSKDIAL